MKIAIKAIRTDGGTQVRAQLSQSQVEEYASQMREGDEFPALDVFHDGSEYWLADGFHRFFAQKSNGLLEMECNVHQGTLRDALWFAIAANKNRGLDLDPKDKRANAERCLRDEEWGKLSYTEIGKHVGLSKMTISRIAREIFPEKQNDVKVVKRQDGTKYKVDTSKNKKRKPPVESQPEETTDAPAYTEDDRLEDAKTQILELEDEVNKLRDVVAVGQWDATEIEKIDIQETIEELRRQNKLLEIDNAALRDSRDMYQNRCSELLRQVKALQAKVKKAGIE